MSDRFIPTPLPIEDAVFKEGAERPYLWHPWYIHNAACHVWKHLSNYIGEELFEEDFNVLKKYIKYDCGDGFKIAKDMDDDGFAEGSTELSEIMDLTYDHSILKQLVNKWTKDTNQTPKFKVGDQVAGRHCKGTITQIDMEEGRYTVFDPTKHTRQDMVKAVLKERGMVSTGTLEKWEDCKEVTNG